MPETRKDQEVRGAMKRYQKASSRHAADAIAKASGDRYSELSRLSYFKTVDNFLIAQFIIRFFLGLVEDIGNAIIVEDDRFIDANERETFHQRLIPYDVGRLPRTMLQKMSGRGITAQQWKNFIITFARVCLWKQVSEEAYKLVRTRACEIVLHNYILKMTSTDWKHC